MKYHERGIPVVPLSGKVPIVANWTVWSEREQTTDEVEWLVEKFPNANIGFVLGRWATALDIDTNDERLLQRIPYTPFRRRGATGISAIYRASKLPNQNNPLYPIEVLAAGRQIVAPPSIHPDSKEPYLWVGEEEIDADSVLPELTQAHVDELLAYCVKEQILRPKTAAKRKQAGEVTACLTDAGRNNKLSAMAYAMACDGVEQDEAVERLLAFDKSEHDVPWFSDPSEPHRGRDPRAAATRMFARAVKKAQAKGHVREVVELDISGLAERVQQPMPLYPRARGLIRDFVDYCELISRGRQDALGLGGGLALMATICSNRFRTRMGGFNVWPNLFVINLASSGFGKETPQRVIDELLSETTLIGNASYKSGTSIVMSLPEQQERIDLIDECSALLKAMTSQDDYKSEIVEILSLLYSKSDSRFIGTASRADGARFGACWNPCVNILGSTTPAGFRSSVNRDMAAKGLLPRFLMFWQRDVGEFKRVLDQKQADTVKARLQRHVRLILAQPKPLFDGSGQQDLLAPEDKSVRYDPTLIPMSSSAERALTDIAEYYFNEGKANPDAFDSAFKNRFAQHVAKLALLDAVGLGFGEITVDQVDWAHSVVKAQWEAAGGLYELANAQNEHERHVIGLLQFFKENPIVRRTDLWKRCSHLKRHELDGILKQLENGGLIMKAELPSNGGRKPIVYKYLGQALS